MTMIRYNIQTGENGSIVIPTTPFAMGEEVEVVLKEKYREAPSRNERRARIAAERAKITDRTPEEWQVAVDDFMTSWKGCLKGVPHMTAKEIRAERLEQKYGQRGENE